MAYQKKVTAATPINTKEWNSMLNDEETKKELYSFISERLCEVDIGPGVSLITTLADKVITQPECDTNMVGALMPCNHQEADSRMCFISNMHRKMDIKKQ